MSSPESIETPVLIVGGGIVGLSASLFLSHHGIQNTLVERNNATSLHPRSRGFNARVMELYREIGLDQEIRDVGQDLNQSRGMYQGYTLYDAIAPHKRRDPSDTQGGMPTDAIARMISPAPGTRATQDFVEPVLLKAARERQGCDIRFSTECFGVDQNADGAFAEIRDLESWRTTKVRAQYLIAADGPLSPIRKRLGIKLEGKGLLGNLFNILFEADLRSFVERREFSLVKIDRPEVRGLFGAINNHNRWNFQLCWDPESGETASDYTPERCLQLLKIALGMPEVDIKIISILPWKSAVRVVETLHQGRIFLAGDAAHLMPPWRGQGATSGVADVHNLAWKLACVLKNQAEPSLLDTYNIERLPVDRRVAEISGDAADAHGLIDIRWTAMLKLLGSILRIVGGFGYCYESQAIMTEAMSQYFRIPWYPVQWYSDLIGRPGTRIPHLWMSYRGKQISTLDVCGRRFVLIAGEDADAWRDAATKAIDSLSIDVPVYSVGTSAARNVDLLDEKNAWPYLAGISAKGALLVRPDGFVAWRACWAPSDPAGELQAVLRQILGRS